MSDRLVADGERQRAPPRPRAARPMDATRVAWRPVNLRWGLRWPVTSRRPAFTPSRINAAGAHVFGAFEAGEVVVFEGVPLELRHLFEQIALGGGRLTACACVIGSRHLHRSGRQRDESFAKPDFGPVNQDPQMVAVDIHRPANLVLVAFLEEEPCEQLLVLRRQVGQRFPDPCRAPRPPAARRPCPAAPPARRTPRPAASFATQSGTVRRGRCCRRC